ncbi:cytochrome c3 family protein [Alteraurantiacibacter buctensis]|uniref:Cytochrome C n=1 Tax=Alteraurantiacibacter buctensis TaxID=1503981 RepID=A0A844Z4G9_9SPHN|nr:cytochrome c3 family protein [Alteraurantiacibacter buctensis]MXO73527.1 cytochrome C [Alteraurantiacibacter buctensis]
MDFLIRTIDFTAAGREIVRDRLVSAASLGVGRDAANAIHLPDLAVEQNHVAISATPGSNLITVKALGTLGFTLDGRAEMQASVDPVRGGEVGLGSYRLAFSQEAGDAGPRTVITIRQVADDEGEGKDRLRQFGLAAAMPGKRAMAWIGLAVVLLAFLAVPVWSSLTKPDVEPDIDRPGAVLMDASWSSGALSTAHHALENQCEACHVEPFQPVQDQTCLTCHEDIGDHAEAPRLTRGMPEFTGTDALLWNVAHAFGKPGPGACSDCHTEHEGAGRMEPTRQRFCADCHGTLDARLTDTALGNARDFGTMHPEFQVAALPRDGVTQPQRVSQSVNPRSFPGLKFPHDMHLDARGGVTQMARRLGARAGYGGVLECVDCHQETADGVGFLPVDMEDDCEACHSLVYDKVGSTFRTLSHGDLDQAEADLRALDRVGRRPIVSNRRRPGEFGEGGLYYSNFSAVSPTSLRASALNTDGLCGDCHLRGNPSDGPLAVMPVTQIDRYFNHGWFDHKAHEQEDCTSCHAAETSDAASDLLIPDLASCRDCHMGEGDRSAEVPSTCAMCHSFHPPASGGSAAPRRVGEDHARTIAAERRQRREGAGEAAR